MKIPRKFTKVDQDVYDEISWTHRASKISNPDGSTVFEMNNAEVPTSWSQLATDIIVSKYFRKAGVPQYDADGEVVTDSKGDAVTGSEQSVKQVVHRLAGCWQHWGQKYGYFDSSSDGDAFYDEVAYMLLHQIAAPNSPQWFNTGLNWAYGINGPAQGHWYTDPETCETKPSKDSYTHPQPHACFIQSVKDDLVNEGGIMDLWVREARLFKYGSGTGTNFSSLRGDGEKLSGGGKSSGLMSWLRIGDRAAGAIKSGGTTRRAAKMVCLDLDHPDIEKFINWKAREEMKVAAMAEGFRLLSSEHKDAIRQLDLQLDYDFNGEAYQTVSGQNSNNSVRIPNTFFKRLDEDGEWDLTSRTDGRIVKSARARNLWDQIGFAAWRCADPGIQFDSTINEWHTCPETGRINASNPCSEYMFLDDTACNLASINLLRFYDPATHTFDVKAYEHAIYLWSIVLEISVLMAQYPSKEIARLSYEYRTFGLGYANLGAMLMQMGIPYDSDEGRAIGGVLAAIITGHCNATSAQMAAEHGPFAGYAKNSEHMLRVIRNHRRAAYGVPRQPEVAVDHELGNYEGLQVKPVPLDVDVFEAQSQLSNSDDLITSARRVWDNALVLGEKHGFRNAQVSVIAPTGTIGLLMDCDTTGVEPDFALIKFKKLAGGGYFKIANQSIKPSLSALGYDDKQIREIMTYIMGTLSLDVPMPDEKGHFTITDSAVTFADFLKSKGADEDDLIKVGDALGSALELGFAFNAFVLGEDAIGRLGLKDESELLKGIGLTTEQIIKLNDLICGRGTIEGAPHIKEEHLTVFDCASKCGKNGTRYIASSGHICMMAAVQPFISGAISKTINLPNDATVDDVKAAYRMSWELGLKANALYRDGSKLSQPLNSTADVDDEIDDEEAVEAAQEEVAGEVADVAVRVGDVSAAAGNERIAAPVEKIVEKIVERPMRRRLPDTRPSLTHKFSVAGHEGYLTVGLYEDGLPGELFITMAKEGSTIGGLMDSLGTAISVALQYGVPVESLVNKFSHQRFEPAGMTNNRDIPFAKSLVDYIFRWMGMEFVAGYFEANAPKRPQSKTSKKKAPKPTSARITSATSNAKSIKSAPRIAIDDPKLAQHHQANNSPLAKIHDKTSDVLAAADRQNAAAAAIAATLNEANSQMMGDAPACDVCGSITIRNGTCYKCVNCGNSMGCS